MYTYIEESVGLAGGARGGAGPPRGVGQASRSRAGLCQRAAGGGGTPTPARGRAQLRPMLRVGRTNRSRTVFAGNRVEARGFRPVSSSEASCGGHAGRVHFRAPRRSCPGAPAAASRRRLAQASTTVRIRSRRGAAGVCEKELSLRREPLPCDPAAETALRPTGAPKACLRAGLPLQRRR